MKLSITVIRMFLNITNVCLHGIGIYLLVCLHKCGKSNTQNMYIGNLSVSELLMNCFEILRHSVALSIYYGGIGSSSMKVVQQYVSIIMFVGISFVFYMNMMYITLDRLLNILLNLRYRIYWNNRRAKCLLQGTWVVGSLLTVAVSLAYHLVHFPWETLLYKFVFPTLEFSFIILAFVTYLFIFQKYKSSHTIKLQRQESVKKNKKPDSTFEIFQKSRFFLPLLLIVTFIVFMVIPDLIILFLGIIYGDTVSEILLASCSICYAVSNIVDALIYIFMQDPLRKLFFKKGKQLLGICCCRVMYELAEPESPKIISTPRSPLSPTEVSCFRMPSSYTSSHPSLLSCEAPYFSKEISSPTTFTSRLMSYDTPPRTRHMAPSSEGNCSGGRNDNVFVSDKCTGDDDDDVFLSDKLFSPRH